MSFNCSQVLCEKILQLRLTSLELFFLLDRPEPKRLGKKLCELTDEAGAVKAVAIYNALSKVDLKSPHKVALKEHRDC